MPQIQWRARLLGGALGMVLAGTICLAISSLGDSYIIRNIIVSKGLNADSLTTAGSYITLGSMVGVIVMTVILLWIQRFALWLDPSFVGFSLGTVRMHIFAAAGGLLGVLATGATLVTLQMVDAGLVDALIACGVIYLILWDVIFTRKITLRSIFLPMGLCIAGTVLTTGVQGEGSLLVIFLILGVRNFLKALDEIIKQEGVKNIQPILFTYWRFVWFCIIGTIVSSGVSIARGQFDGYLGAMGGNFVLAVVVMTFVMLVMFVGETWVNAARLQLAASEINLFLSLKTGLITVATWLLSLFSPALVGDFPKELGAFAVRMIGVVLILIGVWILRNRRAAIVQAAKKAA